MGEFIKVIGKIPICMELVSIDGLMGEYMMENMKMIKKM
jgi:hypothetical protein